MVEGRCGETLIELVMVIVVVSVLVGGLSLGIIEVINLWRFLTFHNEIASQGRIALTRMGREIRQMDSRASSESILLADIAHLQFRDINNTVIDYQLSGNSLMRNDDILADNVSSLNFCYYSRDKSPVCEPLCSCNVVGAQLSNIELIGIQLEIQYGGQSKTSRLQVYPRNL